MTTITAATKTGTNEPFDHFDSEEMTEHAAALEIERGRSLVFSTSPPGSTRTCSAEDEHIGEANVIYSVQVRGTRIEFAEDVAGTGIRSAIVVEFGPDDSKVVVNGHRSAKVIPPAASEAVKISISPSCPCRLHSDDRDRRTRIAASNDLAVAGEPCGTAEFGVRSRCDDDGITVLRGEDRFLDGEKITGRLNVVGESE